MLSTDLAVERPVNLNLRILCGNRNTIPTQSKTTCSWLPACVNRKLLPFKLHYFLFIAGEAGVGPYIAVVGRRNGIGPATMAVIFAIMPLTAVVFKPVCGFIIDRTRNVTAVILVLQVLCTIFYGIAFFCPSAISDGATYQGHLSCPLGEFDVTGTSGSERCPSSESGSLFCVLSTEKRVWEGVSASLTLDGKIVLANESAPCTDLRKNESLANDSLVVPGDMKCSCDAALYHNPNFWIYAVSAILGFALAAALNNVGDAAVSNALGSDIEVFGRQRLFGTLSYGMTSPLIGYLVDVASSETFTDYRPCFYVFASAMLLDMILILSVARMRVAEVSVDFFKDIAQLLSSPEILLFTFFTFLVGAMMGFLGAFETWFLEDLGTPTYLIGLTKTIQCFGAEPVLFFLSTYILRRIGYFYSYSVAFLLFACKAIGYSFLRDVWGSLAVNIVGGCHFPDGVRSYGCVREEEGQARNSRLNGLHPRSQLRWSWFGSRQSGRRPERRQDRSEPDLPLHWLLIGGSRASQCAVLLASTMYCRSRIRKAVPYAARNFRKQVTGLAIPIEDDPSSVSP
ncbi:hypothetical protein MTO96_000825 [Rhipicephalus appendiculatus]